MSGSSVPSRACIRARRGSSSVARNRSHVTIDAQRAALSMPTFASSSCAPSNARVATSSETVKPIPAIVPPPATAAQPTGGRSRSPLSRVTSHDAPRMPSGLPATYPKKLARGSLQFWRRLLAELPKAIASALEIGPRRRVGVRQEAHREAHDHRLHARLEQRYPGRRPEHRVDQAPMHAEGAHDEDSSEDPKGGEQR